MATLLLLAEINRLWYAPPLIVGISLVYASTRRERVDHIVRHAIGFGGWTLLFVAGIVALLQLMMWFQ